MIRPHAVASQGVERASALSAAASFILLKEVKRLSRVLIALLLHVCVGNGGRSPYLSGVVYRRASQVNDEVIYIP